MSTVAPAIPVFECGRRQGLAGRLTEVALGYQQMLKKNPRQPEALVGMSLVALASSQPEAAVKMATAAVEAAPELVPAWVALGQALKTAGRNEESEAAYEQALRLEGMSALARMGLGELKLATGRPEEAVREFELALRRQPALVAAHLGLGSALAYMGRNAEALVRYEKALGLKPRLPEAEFAAGFVLARLGRQEEAEKRYRRALMERPDFAAAWMNLGSLLREQGREAHAEAALLRAVELRPDLVAGWINLAILERERRRPEEAEKHLRSLPAHRVAHEHVARQAQRPDDGLRVGRVIRGAVATGRRIRLPGTARVDRDATEPVAQARHDAGPGLRGATPVMEKDECRLADLRVQDVQLHTVVGDLHGFTSALMTAGHRRQR